MWHASSNYGIPDQPGKKVKHVSKEALMASEVHYRRLFETAQDGILILDAETGRISDSMYCSRHFRAQVSTIMTGDNIQ